MGGVEVAMLNRLVRVSLILTVTLESRLERDEGVCGTNILGKGTHPEEERKSQVTFIVVSSIL